MCSKNILCQSTLIQSFKFLAHQRTYFDIFKTNSVAKCIFITKKKKKTDKQMRSHIFTKKLDLLLEVSQTSLLLHLVENKIKNLNGTDVLADIV